MDLTAFALRSEYEGTVEIETDDGPQEAPAFGGGVLAVDGGDFHVRDELARGDGTIVCQENDQVLIDLLDVYPALKRTTVPEKPKAIVDPYERRPIDALRHLLGLRDISGQGDSKAAAVRALNAHDRALRKGDPALAQRIQDGDAKAVDEAIGGDGLDKLTKERLTALAEKHKVALEGASTNPQIVERLRAAGVAKEG